MASYKVPQDVEADDKLIGPFSFRQFIYLIIVAMSIAIAWGLSQLFIPLAIIPLPIIIFFGALALPLRKDQPMEIYMAAIVSYYLKPRERKWDPEGVETLIEISAPKVVEVRRTKDLSQDEAHQRLSYLANIVDTGGWAIRGAQAPSTSLNNDVFMEAQGATDVLDTNTSVAQNFDQMMSQSTARMHEEAKERMLQAQFEPATPPAPVPEPYIQPQAQQPVITPEPTNLQFNPYPTFHQSIIQPLNDSAHQAQSDISPVQADSQVQDTTTATTDIPTTPVEETEKATSDTALTADIMNLANNSDFSIETIAHEAERIHKKAEKKSDGEVFISLR
jgi:hypothetical protein